MNKSWLSTDGSIPLVGYATIALCLVGFLSWRGVVIGRLEARVARAQMAQKQAAGGDDLYMTRPDYEPPKALAELDAAMRSARSALKWGALLLIFLPTATIFPVMLSSREKRGRTGPRVVDVDFMTKDDVGWGLEGPEADRFTAESRTVLVNGGAYLGAAAALAALALWKPATFGGTQSWLFLGVGALLAFSASGSVFALRRKLSSPERVLIALSLGFLLFGGLAAAYL